MSLTPDESAEYEQLLRQAAEALLDEYGEGAVKAFRVTPGFWSPMGYRVVVKAEEIAAERELERRLAEPPVLRPRDDGIGL